MALRPFLEDDSLPGKVFLFVRDNRRVPVQAFLEELTGGDRRKFQGNFGTLVEVGKTYRNRERFTPLRDMGKPLWEFKEHDHRIYCVRKVCRRLRLCSLAVRVDERQSRTTPGRSTLNKQSSIVQTAGGSRVEHLAAPAPTEFKELNMLNWLSETDPDVLSEAALAKAQYLMSHAMRMSETPEKQLAVQMERTPSSIQHMLSSGCDLTVRSLGRFLALCGYRLTIEVEKLPARIAASEPAELRAPGIPASSEHRLPAELRAPGIPASSEHRLQSNAPSKGALVPMLVA